MEKRISALLFKFRFFLLVAVTFVILAEIFLLRGAFDFFVFGLIGGWLGIIMVLKLRAKASFIAALILLILGIAYAVFFPSVVFFGSPLERMVKWAYIFLTIACIQTIFSTKMD